MPVQVNTVSRGLLVAGVLLLMLGLLTGLGIGAMENPRMGLSSHMQGITNGLLLIALGLLWPHMTLPDMARTSLYWLALYGTFANWLATLLAGIWGAGEKIMPIASAGHSGTQLQELAVSGLLLSLTLAMLLACTLALWGLWASSPVTSAG